MKTRIEYLDWILVLIFVPLENDEFEGGGDASVTYEAPHLDMGIHPRLVFWLDRVYPNWVRPGQECDGERNASYPLAPTILHIAKYQGQWRHLNGNTHIQHDRWQF